MMEKFISLILAVIIGFFLSHYVSRVEMKVNQRLLNQYFINNHENLFETTLPLLPPPIPMMIFKKKSNPPEM